VQLSERAYHLIKERIVTLRLRPLAVIDEQGLMQELALGRTPIREALLRLSSEGLIKVVPRRGMFVADIAITDLQKIFEVRIELEHFCAQLAAERVTEAQLSHIEDVLLEMEQIDSNQELMAIDERFHNLVYEAANNEFLASILQQLYALSLRLWYLSIEQVDHSQMQHSIWQHRLILDALRARDGQKAAELLRAHIREFQRQYRNVL